MLSLTTVRPCATHSVHELILFSNEAGEAKVSQLQLLTDMDEMSASL